MSTPLNRRDLLKRLGLAGVGGMAGVGLAAPAVVRAGGAPVCAVPGCVLTPGQTEGPYYFDADLARYDVSEGRPGVALRLGFTVINVDSCLPIPGAVADLWHTDAFGCYSGYAQPGACGNTTGQTFMRGLQTTDGAGYAEFLSRYPGWYPGRTTHIHFKVHFADDTYVTSQLYFPQAISDLIYTTRQPYVTRGLSPTTNANDGIFNNTPNNQRLVMDVVEDGDGYLATIEIGIAGVSPTGTADAPSAGEASLGAVYPNPAVSEATVLLTLPRPEVEVKADAFDTRGRRVARLYEGPLPAGRHPLSFDVRALPIGVYVVRVETRAVRLAQSLAVAR